MNKDTDKRKRKETTSSDDDEWQSIESNGASKQHNKKKMNRRNEYVNRFSLLTPEDEVSTKQDQLPKPPPIFIPMVTNISIFIKNISGEIGKENFSYKSLKDDQIKVMVKTADSFRKIIKYLDGKNRRYHTYQLKQERAYRIVIKGMHANTDTDDIKESLSKFGHNVRNVINARNRITKSPLPMFFVDLEPNKNNQEVFKIKGINNALVSIEPARKTNEIVQCHRCQLFGHTKSYCKRAPKCVKCSGNHLTSDCMKPNDSPPTCTHCKANHTASYKGCTVYKELLSKRNLTLAPVKTNALSFKEKDYPSLAPNNNNSSPDSSNQRQFSYADAVKNNETPKSASNNIMERLEVLMNKQLELTNSLINMMSVIITKLCN